MCHRHPLAWVTLTSAPGATEGRLRLDFQAWRKRLEHSLGLKESALGYAMVDTHEGHGVLHLVLAFPPGTPPWFDFNRAGEWWQEIHGARQVKFKWIGKGDGDVRKLSTYLISQYMTIQGETRDLLGRFSASRPPAPLAAWRRQVYRLVTARGRLYSMLHSVNLTSDQFADVWRDLRRMQFKDARRCWEQLLSVGWFDFDGDRYAACLGQPDLLHV